MNAFTRQDELTLHVGSECMGFFGLVRSRRDADACTHAAGEHSRKHCACAVGGASVVPIPVKNGTVVGLLYRCWRLLITSSLFFVRLSRTFILLDRNQ